MNYKFIESETELQQVCEDLLKEKIIGVDLEADSMHCFKEKICLIQIATEKQAYLIDPFEIKAVPVFIRVLENSDVMTVFHGADFDIRSLDREYQARVKNLFDTEIACRFLGVRERGLGALLKKHFNVDANKKFQKEDWSKRPLSPEMIDYSVGDVTHLIELQDILKCQLLEKGRLSWAEEEFEIQAGVRYEGNHSLPLFVKFKGAGKMDNRTLAVLENLLQMRLTIAEKKDLPLFKVISNTSIMTMAFEKPVTVDRMIQMRVLSPKQAGMYGNLCVDAIVRALNFPHKDLPSYPKMRRPKRDERAEQRIEHLKKMREKLSLSMDMEPGLLLNNAAIEGIAVKNPETSEALLKIDSIRRWQVEAMGEDILSTLRHGRA
ncbi:MAG: HRDC domain-containing protein [Desulfobacula sp.]